MAAASPAASTVGDSAAELAKRMAEVKVGTAALDAADMDL